MGPSPSKIGANSLKMAKVPRELAPKVKNFPAAKGGRQIFHIAPGELTPQVTFFACPCMVPCYTYFKNKADFVKMFVNEERVEMEKYFKSLNETQKRSWHYDEINHRKELIQELDIKVR